MLALLIIFSLEYNCNVVVLMLVSVYASNRTTVSTTFPGENSINSLTGYKINKGRSAQ